MECFAKISTIFARRLRFSSKIVLILRVKNEKCTKCCYLLSDWFGSEVVAFVERSEGTFVRSSPYIETELPLFVILFTCELCFFHQSTLCVLFLDLDGVFFISSSSFLWLCVYFVECVFVWTWCDTESFTEIFKTP